MNFTRISVPHVGQHTPPQLSPSEEGHGIPHLTGAPAFRKSGIVWISSFGTCGTEHFDLHQKVKGSVWQLTGRKQAVPLTTSPNKLLNHNNRDTPIWKNAKNRNPTCVQQIWTTIIIPVILLSFRERPPGTNLTDQPHIHPRMLGHENSPP